MKPLITVVDDIIYVDYGDGVDPIPLKEDEVKTNKEVIEELKKITLDYNIKLL